MTDPEMVVGTLRSWGQGLEIMLPMFVRMACGSMSCVCLPHVLRSCKQYNNQILLVIHDLLIW